MTKQAMRRLWFQAHKWIGLLLAVLIVPVSITGAVLVWHEELEPVLNRKRYAVTGPAALAPDAYVRAARAALKPGERIASLALPEHGGPVVVAAAAADAQPRPGPPRRTNVYLDGATARVLDVAPSNAGALRVMHVLHGSLMVPGVGRSIVGWVGVAMMLSAFTGLWLWWPAMGRWTRGLRWARRRDVDANLHHQMGFWIALPLFVLSLTGAWISFPSFFGALIGEGGRGGQARMAAMRSRPVEATRLSADEALRQASGALPGAPTRITWPTEKAREWSVRFSGGEVRFEDAPTDLLSIRKGEGGGVARLMRRVHDGTGMGLVWRVIITLGGLIPAVLAGTGVIMWWRARRWRRGARRPRVAVV